MILYFERFGNRLYHGIKNLEKIVKIAVTVKEQLLPFFILLAKSL